MATPRWDDKEKRWHYKPQIDGKRKTFYSSKPGKAGMNEAKRKAADYVSAGDRSGRRLFQAWPDYLRDVSARGGTANHDQREQYGRLYLIPALGHKRVRDITDQDWQDVINSAAGSGHDGKPLSKKSLSNLRGTISDFYHFAKRSKMMTQQPDTYIPKSAVVNQHNILQPDDLKRLFANDAWVYRGKVRREWYINAWRLMAVTGLRPGECYGLKVSDIADDTIIIQRSVNTAGEVTDGKNANAKRSIKMHKIARQIIDDQLLRLRWLSMGSGWLFPGRDDAMPNPATIYAAWQSYRLRTGLNCTPYELRHSFVSLVKNDMPAEMVKRIVGHSAAMDTFGTYGHDVDGELDKAAEIMNEHFSAMLK